MKVVSIVGARPQFIKAAPLIERLREAGHQHALIHTGQHYDAVMSDVFFQELDLPKPDLNLGVGSGRHGEQTGRMLIGLEAALRELEPDIAVVYGDTNSTLAGALAAVKLPIPLAHVEAGLRSGNRAMPEEHNRVLTDHCATWLFCPTQGAVEHLAREGITAGVHLVGDTMHDALQRYLPLARSSSRVLERLELARGGYFVATLHRPHNTDAPARLLGILRAFEELEQPVVLPLHPRTRACMARAGYAARGSLRLVEPLGYLDMLALQEGARAILTDSGGVQREAFWLRVPCVTLREETEWLETVASGWSCLVGSERDRILSAARGVRRPPEPWKDLDDGQAASRIVALLEQGEPS